MPRSTEPPASSDRGQTLKQLSLIVAIIVLGLGALGAHYAIGGMTPSSPEAVPLRASGVSATPAEVQVHPAANADQDVGPGEAESSVAACPPAVR